jgi:hypothetical protein
VDEQQQAVHLMAWIIVYLLWYTLKLQMWLRAAGRKTLLYTEQRLHNIYRKI